MALLDAMTEELNNTDGNEEGNSGGADSSFSDFFGHKAFLPNDKLKALENTGGGGRVQSPAAIDPATMQLKAPFVMPGSGQSQIRNLQQLGMVAKSLSGLPPEIKNKILSHLLGLTYRDPHSAQYQQQTNQTLLRQMLAQPAQQQRLANQREGLNLRREGLQGREEDRLRGRNLQKQMLDFRKENQKSMLQLHKDQARNTITNSIANLTRAMEATSDPKMQLEIGKLLQKQHQLYQKFEGLDESEANNAAQSGESTSTGRGSEY